MHRAVIVACTIIVGVSRTFALGTPSHEVLLAHSGDAYVRELRTTNGICWRFGTAQVEKQVQLTDGHLTLVSFTDRATRHEYVQGPSDIVSFSWDGQVITGHSTAWVLERATTQQRPHGVLLLQLRLRSGTVAIVKSYLLYPQEGIIQEWLTVINRSSHPGTLRDLHALDLRMMQHEADQIDFSYMSGSGNYTLHTKPQIASQSAKEPLTFSGTGAEKYAPIQVYQNRQTLAGVFVGWDYIGTWSSSVGTVAGEPPIHVDFRLGDDYEQPLQPGDSVEAPKVFTGVFHGDLDAMGHELLDYQYRYKWDYTRTPYFPSVAMLGDWFTGSGYGAEWQGGLDPLSTYRKVLSCCRFRGHHI